MFEFGRDLRRLFEKARDSYDLGWLELVSASLVGTEARHQATDAGRVSCARPFEAWMRAAALWREHARRTGAVESLRKAEQAGRDAARAARSDDQALRAALDVGQTSLLAFDLYGAPYRLTGLLDSLARLPVARRSDTSAELDAMKARLRARQVRLGRNPEDMAEAARHLAECVSRLRPDRVSAQEEICLERAALSLEAGLLNHNARLLDLAGRELRELVENASADERPVSRARALALCGTGMAALAAIAADESARSQAHALFDAAAEQFTPDHSPLDWAAIQFLKAERDHTDSGTLFQARAMTNIPGLVLGALLRERCHARTIDRAARTGDSLTLKALREDIRQRLTRPMDETLAIEWASDQISIARITLASRGASGTDMACDRAGLGMALFEAADAAEQAGVPALARRARELMDTARLI